MAAMDRIRGLQPENPLDAVSPEFVLNRGFARLQEEMGRRTVVGNSVAGMVNSCEGQLRFSPGSGAPNDGIGVGFSVGQN
jgi:hypothetical protein